MKPCENVIVTLTGGAGGLDYDMELPTFLAIGQLKEKLEETLRVMDPRLLPPGQELQLQYRGRILADDGCLAGAGVWDGSRLLYTIKKEGQQ